MASAHPKRLAIAAVLVAIAVVACDREPPPLAAADATYETSGVVQRHSGRKNGFEELVVRHRTIDEFRNRDGEVVGMESMSMPFSVAPEVPLAELSPRDPVQFTFEVRWSSDPVLLITAIEELPAGTEIDFSPPTAATEGADATDAPEPAHSTADHAP